MIKLKIVIVGAGKTGKYLVDMLKSQDIDLVVIDKNRDVVSKLKEDGINAYLLDACDPVQLSKAGIQNADVAAVVTGHDEDNLVISNLLKKVFNVKRVVARINHPLNEWIYDSSWGVDIGVSATHIIADLIVEEMKLKKAIEILKIKGGTVSVVEANLDPTSYLVGKKISELNLPANSLIVTVIREGKFYIPDGSFVFEPGDGIIAVCSADVEQELLKVFES